METWILTTEGDCEGRSTRELGTFRGSKEQIMQYCIDTGLKPYYSFSLKKASPIIDVSNIDTDLAVFEDSYGRIKIL